MPLFFEVHRLSVFTPRSLDVDVVLDLMIHDLDIILHIMGEMPSEIRAAGISVLSQKVDIANVRLAFTSGCVANLTASRVSTEQIRKLRLFQPGEYLAVDYKRQDLTRFHVLPKEQIAFDALSVEAGRTICSSKWLRSSNPSELARGPKWTATPPPRPCGWPRPFLLRSKNILKSFLGQSYAAPDRSELHCRSAFQGRIGYSSALRN